MKRFEVGERYTAYGSKQGMLVIWRSVDKLGYNIDGVEYEKMIWYFAGAETVWTDDWHVAIAHYKQEVTE